MILVVNMHNVPHQGTGLSVAVQVVGLEILILSASNVGFFIFYEN